jgi:hypothetical protein
VNSAGRSLVIAYICLVGFPLLAVVEMLDLGHNLQAPPDIAGSWKMEAQAGAWQPTCAKPSSAPVLDISQSGKFLILSLPGFQGSGVLETGSRVSGDLLPVADGCRGNLPLHLEATLPALATGRIAGIIRAAGCDTCAPVSFAADRVKVPSR